MKKASFLLFLSFVVAGSIFSQKRELVKNLALYDQRKLHFGFTVGLNTSDFYIRNSDTFFDTSIIKQVYGIENAQAPGFHLGPISNFRIGKYFDFRVLLDLTFTQRDLSYVLLKENQDGQEYFTSHTMKLSSTFIEFPLLIKYKSERINNYRVYVIGGIKPVLDLASKKKIPEEEMPMIRLKQPDLYGEFGAGIDFYLPYFKFSPELKMGVGLDNVAVEDDTEFTGALKYLKSKIFMLSFHFE